MSDLLFPVYLGFYRFEILVYDLLRQNVLTDVFLYNFNNALVFKRDDTVTGPAFKIVLGQLDISKQTADASCAEMLSVFGVAGF